MHANQLEKKIITQKLILKGNLNITKKFLHFFILNKYKYFFDNKINVNYFNCIELQNLLLKKNKNKYFYK
jgi:hypothetical protein